MKRNPDPCEGALRQALADLPGARKTVADARQRLKALRSEVVRRTRTVELLLPLVPEDRRPGYEGRLAGLRKK